MTIFFLVLLIIIGGFAAFQVLIRVFRKSFHFPAPAFIGGFLDSNIRKMVQPVEKLIRRSGVKKNMTVLEVGCGNGAFVTHAARTVGNAGKVYGLDIQTGMLKLLKKKLQREEYQDIDNLVLVHGDARELPFEDNLFDLVYMVSVLQEIPDQEKALSEICRVLKSNGILSISEFLPDPDYPLKGTTVKTLESYGFVIEESPGNLWNYTVRSRKAGC